MASEVFMARESSANPINAVARGDGGNTRRNEGDWASELSERVRKKLGDRADAKDPNDTYANFRILTPSQSSLGGGMSMSVEQFYDERGNSTYHTAVFQSYTQQ